MKVNTLDIAPLHSESPSQKRSGMARVLKGFHSCTQGWAQGSFVEADLPDRANTESETMRQSRGRGSKVETEARPRQDRVRPMIPRPSQLKKLPRGRLEPRQMPRGLHPWFYLHTYTFIRNRNEPYLPLPSQPQLVLIYRPRRDGKLSRPWCEVVLAEIRTRNLPIANPALYHTTTSAPCDL